MNVNSNTVLITGGGSGIGLALAEAFLAEGNEVLICGHRQALLDRALKRLPTLHTFNCDLSDDKDLHALALRICEYFPRLNVLVNTAAVAEVTDLKNGHAAEHISNELSVVLRAPILLTMQFLPHLLQRPEAAVVNITTASAYVHAARYPGYCAAKAGLHSFSQSLRHQLQDTSVSVFEVLPPISDTLLNEEDASKVNTHAVTEQILRGMRRDLPEIRIGQTRALYAMARFLPRAAFSLMNGKASR